MFGLFKWVEDLVNGIINQVLQQVNIIQDAVTSPLRALVNQVTGGIWKGDGASRFVQEMTSEVIPMLVNIMGFNTNFANAIKKSQDRMQQAVQQATSQAQTLLDVFGGIF
jgi:hypothetical protein